MEREEFTVIGILNIQDARGQIWIDDLKFFHKFFLTVDFF